MQEDESKQVSEFYEKLENFVDSQRRIIWDAEKKREFLTKHKEKIRLLAMDLYSIGGLTKSSPDFQSNFEKFKKNALLNAKEVQVILVNSFASLDLSPETNLSLISESEMNLIAETVNLEVERRDAITNSKFSGFPAAVKSKEELNKLLKLDFEEKNLVEALDKRIVKYEESLSAQKENIEKEIKELNSIHHDLSSGDVSMMKSYASNLLKTYSSIDSAVRVEQIAIHNLADSLYEKTHKSKEYAESLLNRKTGLTTKIKNIFSFRRPNAITIEDLKKDLVRLSNPQDVNQYRTLIAYSGLLGKRELRFLRSVEFKSNLLERKNNDGDLHNLNQKLAQTKDESVKDGLTGVHNRRFFDKRFDELKAQYSHPRRASEQVPPPVSILMIDLDHFKLVNDGFGHKAGDIILSWVATTIQKTIKRKDDVLARYGGEEFVLILPGDDKDNATRFAEMLRSRIESESPAIFSRFKPLNSDLAVKKNQTLSIGVASFPEDGAFGSIQVLADERVFKAKNSGRNRVINE